MPIELGNLFQGGMHAVKCKHADLYFCAASLLNNLMVLQCMVCQLCDSNDGDLMFTLNAVQQCASMFCKFCLLGDSKSP